MKENYNKTNNNIRYDSINGLRTYAAIGIILMHVLVNGHYAIDNVANTIIISFTEFVLLFLIISGFSMCCGYYDKVKNNKINLNDFYKKRYKKIWPYFFILVILDLVIERTGTALIEGFTDLTLVYGLLPNNNISVIGVAWTLGVIFLFYMLFPFYVFLLDNKKRGWFVLVISIILNILCYTYFFEDKFVVENFVNRQNFLFSFMYFLAGGMIYLYKDKVINIVKKFRYVFLIITILLSILAISVPVKGYLNSIKWLIIFSIWLMYAIGVDSHILNNRFTKFVSNISMEIYLTHMVIFRLIEKANLIYIFGNNAYSYAISSILTFLGSIVFAIIVKKVLAIVDKKMKSYQNKTKQEINMQN